MINSKLRYLDWSCGMKVLQLPHLNLDLDHKYDKWTINRSFQLCPLEFIIIFCYVANYDLWEPRDTFIFFCRDNPSYYKTRIMKVRKLEIGHLPLSFHLYPKGDFNSVRLVNCLYHFLYIPRGSLIDNKTLCDKCTF